MVQYFASFLTSVAVSAGITWIVRWLASRYGLLKAPDSARHIHSIPVPRLGGVAVFLTFQLLFLLYWATSKYGWTAGPRDGDVVRIVLLATAFFLVGVIDDLVSVSPRLKLLVEIAGAAALYFAGIHFGLCSSHFAGWWSPAICLVLTVLWVVLICNAINLIDGLDGLAAGAALFSMVTIFTLALGSRPGVAAATSILAGSVFGFLIFNFNPASIFLGDSGSLFIGFLLSAFVLAESQKRASTLDSLLVPVIAFALPLTDVGLSLLRRFLSGHSIFGADREHIHHKLLELGLSQRQVVWVLYGISALCAVLSLFLLSPSIYVLIPVGSIMLLLIFFGLRKLRYHEFGEFQRLGQRVVLQKKILARNIALRKAAAGLQNASSAATITALLEGCLAGDFDGFEIVLDNRFAPVEILDGPGNGRSINIHWKASEERLVITLDLSTSSRRPLGRLSLYQGTATRMLIDTELLKGGFRSSLERALQNAMSRPIHTRIPVALVVDGHQARVPAAVVESEM